MRTSVNLDDDVHRFAAIYAEANGISLGEAVSQLVRKGQIAEAAAAPPTFERSTAGIPVFPKKARRITTAMVREAEDELE